MRGNRKQEDGVMEVRRMSKYFFNEANMISICPIEWEGKIVFRKISFAVPSEKWEGFKKSELFQNLNNYIENQGNFTNNFLYGAPKDTVKLEYKKAKDIFDNNTNPLVKDISVDEKGRVLQLREAKSPATLEMVQYYYYLGNYYKDKIDTKANMALCISAISTFVFIVFILLGLL